MADQPESPRPAKRVKLDDEHNSQLSPSINGAAQKPSPTTASLSIGLPINTDIAKEAEVGITAFVDNSRPTFYGLLKKRYTDFLVNEVLPDGTVAHLREVKAVVDKVGRNATQAVEGNSTRNADAGTATGGDEALPMNGNAHGNEDVEQLGQGAPTTTGETKTPRGEPSDETTKPTDGKISDEDRAKLVEYFSEETVQELTVLYNSILRFPHRKSKDHPTVRTPFTSDRNVRPQIHQAIRRIFSSKIDSSTDNEGILILTAASSKPNQQSGRGPSTSSKSGDRGFQNKLTWADRGGEYLHFNLYKENKDTMEVIGYLFRQLKMNAKGFQFAGTKDRRAATVQRVSAYRVDAARMASLNKTLRFAAVGDFKYEKYGLELGELTGNEFVITLRECRIGDDDNYEVNQDTLEAAQTYLSSALRSLHDHGYLNYYGLQRFGTFAQRTDIVGLKILQGDFQGAVETILQFSPVALEAANSTQDHSNAHPTIPTTTGAVVVGQDDRARAQAINQWNTTGKSSKALELMPRRFSAETSIIRHLGRQRSDYLGALLSVQRNLRLMYVHAYQSLVWNLAVGQRWSLFGDRVVEGDLVLVHEHKSKESRDTSTTDQNNSNNHTSTTDPSNADADGEIIIQPSGADRASDPDERFERARALSASEAASGQYSIFDIVLPLPGFDVEYPANAVGTWYAEFMASEAGGGLDLNSMRRKQKDFSLSGGYRKVLARIGEVFDVRVYTYGEEDGDRQFVKTDLELLKEKEAEKGEGKGAGDDNAGREHGETQNSNVVVGSGPQKLAAVLKFQLGSSQYATMALRELSKGGIQAHKTEFMGGR